MSDTDQIEKLEAALESPKHNWRTVNGLASELKLPVADVVSGLRRLRDANRVVSNISTDGREVFTTREHYQKTMPISSRLMAAWRNRSS